MLTEHSPDFETKFARFGDTLTLSGDAVIEGYASLFHTLDQGDDIVLPGAYAASLAQHRARGTRVKMLWQHDPAQPIGIWDDLCEDARGLKVRGRILTETQQGAEAAALVQAGAIEGLSIGYRTVKSSRSEAGHRQLAEVALWEVSLVTFPMLPTARVSSGGAVKSEPPLAQAEDQALRALATALRAACAP